jgi:GTP pyrophosphokinase
MRTLEHKEPHKQIRSANETLSIFVPLAYFIGAFRLKCELEDLCFKYLEPEEFKNIKNKLKDIEKEYESCLKHADERVGKILKEHNISYTNRVKMLNPYHIHEKLNQGYKLNNIHDLVNFKVIVDTEEDCYRTLGLIHKLYTPVNNKFKDYIACPKTNKYRSIHTTVFTPDNQLLQFQIKTEEMDYLNTFGLAAYWRMYREQGPSKMKTELKSNYQFFNNLQHLNDFSLNDFEYLELVKNEIFTTNIYVYTLDGAVVELPNGASVIDFAYKVHTDIGNHINKVYVNGKEVKLSYKLQNKDRVMILPSEKAHPEVEWLDYVVTSNARRYITKYLKQ